MIIGPGIGSDPIRVCICIDQRPICNITSLQQIIYPGQTITIRLVAVGQRYGPVATYAAAEVVKFSNSLQSGKLKYLYQNLQEIQTYKSLNNYTVESMNSKETIHTSVYKVPNIIRQATTATNTHLV